MTTKKRKRAARKVRRLVRLWFRWDDSWRPSWTETNAMPIDDAEVLRVRLQSAGFIVSRRKPNK